MADDDTQIEIPRRGVGGEGSGCAPARKPVAIVGFPKRRASRRSSNRLSGDAAGGRPRDLRCLRRDRKELVRRVERAPVPAHRHRRRRYRRREPDDPLDRRPGAPPRSRRPTSCLFVVDAQIGITPGDEEVAQILRESKKPVLVIANKIDDPRMEPLALELHRLGLGDPIPISGLHGPRRRPTCSTRSLDYLEAHQTQGPRSRFRTRRSASAILGRRPERPARSTLLNKLVGSERVIVLRDPRHDPRLDRHDPRARRSHLRTRPTQRDCAASGKHRQGHRVLTRSCARSSPRERADVAPRPHRRDGRPLSTRISQWPTSRARPTARR